MIKNLGDNNPGIFYCSWAISLSNHQKNQKARLRELKRHIKSGGVTIKETAEYSLKNNFLEKGNSFEKKV